MMTWIRAVFFFISFVSLTSASYASKYDTKSVVRWLERADADLRSAHVLHENEVDHATVCFHAHQAVEKHLKGLAYHLGRPPKKIHYTNEIAANLEKKIPELKSFERRFRALDNWYIPSRYPLKREKRFTVEDATQCLETADALSVFVSEYLEP